jgi:hypothetical protein
MLDPPKNPIFGAPKKPNFTSPEDLISDLDNLYFKPSKKP